MRDKNLISGQFERILFWLMREEDVSPRQVWNAFPSASGIRSRLYQKIYQGRDQGFSEPAAFYLLEKFSADFDKLHSFQVASWPDLIADKDESEILNELRRLCDWIESYEAFNRFELYRTLPETTKEDQIEAHANSVAARLISSDEMRERDKAKRWRQAVKWTSWLFGIPFIEKLPQVANALPLANAKVRRDPYSELEYLLFRLWPIVLHNKWTTEDLHIFVQAEELDPDDRFSEPLKYLANRGLHVLIKACERKHTVGIRHRALPGFAVARTLSRFCQASRLMPVTPRAIAFFCDHARRHETNTSFRKDPRCSIAERRITY